MRERPDKSEQRNRSRSFAPKGGRRPAHACRKPARAAAPRGTLYGWHSVAAALRNPARKIGRLWAAENALRRLADDGIAAPRHTDLVRPDAIAARLPGDAVHQGLLAE